jgi:hypothetical protein
LVVVVVVVVEFLASNNYLELKILENGEEERWILHTQQQCSSELSS